MHRRGNRGRKDEKRKEKKVERVEEVREVISEEREGVESKEDYYWFPLFAFFFVIFLVLLSKYVNSHEKIGSLEIRNYEKMKKLFPSLDNFQGEVLKKDMRWVEGPLFVNDQANSKKYVLFSEVKKNRIWKWEQGSGLLTIGATLFAKDSGCTQQECEKFIEPGSNGLALEYVHPRDAKSKKYRRIVRCEHGNRRITTLTKDGSYHIYASDYDGRRFNSPNDLAFSFRGDLYFTDPPYGLPDLEKDELYEHPPYNGVYRIPRERMAEIDRGNDPSVPVELVTRSMCRPNGIAFFGNLLFVGNSNNTNPEHPVMQIRKFKLDFSGAVKNGDGEVFYDFGHLSKTEDPSTGSAFRAGNVDGFKIDKDGNIFTSCPGGICILTQSAEWIGTILTDGRKTSNCAIGEDGFLYVTADDALLRFPIKAKPFVVETFLPESDSS